MEGQEKIIDLGGNGEEKNSEEKNRKEESNETQPKNNSNASPSKPEKQAETKNQVEHEKNNETNHEELNDEETTIEAASLGAQERTAPKVRRASSPSNLAKPWLSYARAVCRGLQSQLNSADRTLSSMVESSPDSATIKQLREGQRAAMRKVLKELSNLTKQAATIEQSCLSPKMVKESVEKKSKGKERKNNPDKSTANSSKPVQEPSNEQPVDQPMDGEEETGQTDVGQPAAGSGQPAASSEQLATSSGQLTTSSEQPANPTATLSSIIQNEFKCSICQELMVNATNLSCSHVFCKCCIDEWLERNRRCPVCRKGIRSSSKRHHVLPIDNFLQLYFTKFGTSEQQAERTRLIGERRSREVILIEDDSPPAAPTQPGAGHFVYSLGLAMDGEIPRTRNRHRHRHRGRRRRENSIYRMIRLNRERANRVRENAPASSAQEENAVGSNETQRTLDSTNSRPTVRLGGNLNGSERPDSYPIEVITGSRRERRTVTEQRTNTRRPTPIVSARQSQIHRRIPPYSLAQRTATRATQTEPPAIEILPIIDLDELAFDELAPLGFEIDLIELDETENDQSNGSGSDGTTQVRRDRLTRRERSRRERLRRRNRRHSNLTSNELTSNEPTSNHARSNGSTAGPTIRSRRRRREQVESISSRRAARLANQTSTDQTLNDGATTDRTMTDRTMTDRTISSRTADRTRSDRLGNVSRSTRGRRLRQTVGTPNRPSVTDETAGVTAHRAVRRLNNENATASGTSDRLRTSSARLSANRSADVRSRREERRRARREERRQARRARRLDINDYVLGRKHPH